MARTSYLVIQLQHQSNKKNIKRKHIWYARHRWSTSSEKSPQSLLPSQVFLKCMHFLFVHSNPEPVKHILFSFYIKSILNWKCFYLYRLLKCCWRRYERFGKEITKWIDRPISDVINVNVCEHISSF